MGTRSDFYIGRGKDAEWIGSIAWDGYPEGITPNSKEKEPMYPGGPMCHKNIDWPKGEHLFDSKTEKQFRERLVQFFQHRDDVTLPENGWPWPWEDSNTTDYAYALAGEKVLASCFGSPWFDPLERMADEDSEDEPNYLEESIFPDMSEKANNPEMGSKKSGVMIIAS